MGLIPGSRILFSHTPSPLLCRVGWIPGAVGLAGSWVQAGVSSGPGVPAPQLWSCSPQPLEDPVLMNLLPAACGPHCCRLCPAPLTPAWFTSPLLPQAPRGSSFWLRGLPHPLRAPRARAAGVWLLMVPALSLGLLTAPRPHSVGGLQGSGSWGRHPRGCLGGPPTLVWDQHDGTAWLKHG